ncbi:MAG TPA: GNAT family N-acetyltransferase [Gemmatimonadaceae bacterium]
MLASLMADTPQVINNTAVGRFEIPTEIGTATLTYVRRGDTLDLTHTKVPPELEGRGYASALVRAALDYARNQHLRIIPTCPFVQGYLRRHNEYADIVG